MSFDFLTVYKYFKIPGCIAVLCAIVLSCSQYSSGDPSTGNQETYLSLDVEISKAIEMTNAGQLNAATMFLDSLFIVAEELDDKVSMSRIAIELSYLHLVTGRFEFGAEHLRPFIPMIEQNLSPEQIFLAKLRLASLYNESGQTSKAIETIEVALSDAGNNLDPLHIFGGMTTRAAIYNRNREYARAIELYQDAIKYASQFEQGVVRPANIAVAHNNLGLMLHNLGRYDEALREFSISYEVNTSVNNITGISQNLNNIANTYESLQQHEVAIDTLRSAITLNLSSGATGSVVRNYYNLGNNLLKMGNIANAHEAFTSAYEISDSINFPFGIMYSSVGLARTHSAMGNYSSSEFSAIRARDIASVTNNAELLVEIAELLADLYEKSGNFKGALEQLKIHRQLNDSLTSLRTQREIEEVRSSYDFELLSNERALLEQELLVYELQERRYLMYLILLLVTTLGIGMSLYIYNRKNRQIQQKNVHLERLNYEKDTLTKIIVHDLRNPLTSLMGALNIISIGPENPDERKELISIANKSADKLNQMINGLLTVIEIKDERIQENLTQVSIKSLVEDVIKSIGTEAKRKNIELQYQVGDFKVTTHASYITRILENLISNAVKFSPPDSVVLVCSELTEKGWKLSVLDNGPGFSQDDRMKAFRMFQKLSAKPTSGENTTGLGLYTVQTLTEKLGGKVIIGESTTGAEITCLFETVTENAKLY